MDLFKDLLVQMELHSAGGIRHCFENGINPNQWYNGRPLIEELIGEYYRSDRFKECVKVFVDYGLVYEDKALLAVLLDDASTLRKIVSGNPELVHRSYTLRSAYTPLEEVSLLHICAEFNHLSCAEVLVDFKADVNRKAGIDQYGFGGQTPVFHTVNQNQNHSKRMLEFLVSKSADLTLTIKGIIWGKGYEWETFLPSINPISYAMMGLLPQMHRDEQEIYEVIKLLVRTAYHIDYLPGNIPNKYLQS